MSKPDNAAAKKTDAVQPDDDEVEQSQGDSVPEEEKSQQDQTAVDDLQNEASAEQGQANDAEVIEADAVITASTSSADDNTTEVGGLPLFFYYNPLCIFFLYIGYLRFYHKHVFIFTLTLLSLDIRYYST